MCSNYEPISKNRAHLLDLYEPTFDYNSDIYPSYNAPILISANDNIEWHSARFGLIPFWTEDLERVQNTFNAQCETIATKPSFKNAWKNNQFCLIPVETIFEPKYIDGKAIWYGIYRQDSMPFTLAGLYEQSSINGKSIISMTMITINADSHPFMQQFHASEDEKRSVVVIPRDRRNNWLRCDNEEATQFLHEFSPDDYTAAPKFDMHKFRPNTH
ncbi:SOS response-associated peptidase [Acinetobacter dispersus]|uniref:SOS response-associated peptidase n=1 Tax=Acinetobacter dispersus TaxID=70348 RepID=UPI0021CDD740|nr:SOS response-associated peptidase [Acinetobacter dispersus]MCU4337999.1 SOS response-associated peptidase [Acinetobacter dispersus]